MHGVDFNPLMSRPLFQDICTDQTRYSFTYSLLLLIKWTKTYTAFSAGIKQFYTLCVGLIQYAIYYL